MARRPRMAKMLEVRHDEGVGGDGEDGRDGIHREDHVGKLHQHQDQEQRRRRRQPPPSWRRTKKALALQGVGDLHVPAQPGDQRVLGQIGVWSANHHILMPVISRKAPKT